MEAKNTIVNLVGEGDYIVNLPRAMRGVDGYDLISKTAETHAGSERDAVSNALFRALPEDKARIVMDRLNKNYGGAERRAVIIPDTKAAIILGKYSAPKTGLDTDNFEDYALAMELAAKDGSNHPERYIGRARNLLKQVGRFS